jgi:hypothetical protein
LKSQLIGNFRRAGESRNFLKTPFSMKFLRGYRARVSLRMGAEETTFMRLFILCALLLGGVERLAPQSNKSVPTRIASVRMRIRDNRVFIPLQVSGPNGKIKTVLFWVDSGGDIVFLSGPVARELGLREAGPIFNAMGHTRSHFVTKPGLALAGMKIELADVSVAASLSNSKDAFVGVEAGGFLPATVLKHFDVVLDYPALIFTLARSGSITHRGVSVPMMVQPKTGFARVELEIEGERYGFLLDTGAAYTGISRSVMDDWAANHPLWHHSIGAVGAADMVGKEFDAGNELLRIPEIQWGSIRLRNVGMVSRSAGVYEKSVSEDMAGPIVGALSGNVLRRFRLDLDYPGGVAYLKLDGSSDFTDLACAGIVLEIKDNGDVVVSGVSRRDGVAEIAGVEPGDIILRVDDHEMTGSSLAMALDHLSGTPGHRKLLTIQRGGKVLSVSVTVTPHP